MHGVRTHPGPYPGKGVKGHGFARSLTSHPIEIVHEVEDDGQAAAHGLVPKLIVLPHAGKVHGLPSGTASHRSVAYIGDDESPLAVNLLEEG